MRFIFLELRFLVFSLFCGFLLGTAYYIIKIFRRLVYHHPFFIGLEDMIYWLVSSLVMFSVILVANDGKVRFFAIVAMIVGIVAISYILKCLDKWITMIYYKIGKALYVHGRKSREIKKRRTGQSGEAKAQKGSGSKT